MRWPFWLCQAGERGWTLRGLVRRPWGGRGYAGAELPLWRWQESPVDDAIAAFVRRGRRPELRGDDAVHLLHFAARSALRALRERDRQHLTDAFGALSLINVDDLDHLVDDLDYRDAATRGYLAVCVAKELGVSAPEAFDEMARANPDIAATLVGDDEDGGVYLANLPNLSGERVVWTPTGPALVGDLSDDEDPFRPDHDLVGLALRLAEALRRQGYHVDVDIMGSRPYVPSQAAPEYAAAAAGVTGWISVEGAGHHAARTARGGDRPDGGVLP
jgi:hypothetical protein